VPTPSPARALRTRRRGRTDGKRTDGVRCSAGMACFQVLNPKSDASQSVIVPVTQKQGTRVVCRPCYAHPHGASGHATASGVDFVPAMFLGNREPCYGTKSTPDPLVWISASTAR